mmetsp:Transcript_19161/g.53435  ORF Transcript_19161/g.53435 Transcript_19161/m.53435 type:complete len:736 (+) Transcript_19161:115-2322(+)
MDNHTSFDSEATEDPFERQAKKAVNNPKNKDMLGQSEDLGSLGLSRTTDMEPAAGHHPPPVELMASDDQEDVIDDGRHAARRAPRSPDSYSQYTGDESMTQSFEDQQAHGALRRGVTYSSPYRRSVDSQGYSFSQNSQSAELQQSGDDRHTLAPQHSTSPRGFPPRRPFSAGTKGWRTGPQQSVDSVAGASQETSSPNYQGARLRRILQGMMKRDPRTWDVTEVRYWLDFVGLSQHRYKFGGQAVDGRTLLMLTDEALRVDIGVHAVGQRQLILACIEDLKVGLNLDAKLPPRPRRRPSSAPAVRPEAATGGALGTLSLSEQYQKLQRDLDKAQLKADKLARDAMQAAKLADLSAVEVNHLKKQMKAVKRAFKREGIELPIDCDGTEIWRPTGNNTAHGHWDSMPKKYGTDTVVPDANTKPKISKNSREIANKNQHTKVWKRAENDLKQREADILEKQRMLEEEMRGPLGCTRRKQSNFQIIKKYFREKLKVEFPKDEGDRIRCIKETVDAFSDKLFKENDKELRIVLKLQGLELIEAVANVCRTNSFMVRVEKDLEKQKIKPVKERVIKEAEVHDMADMFRSLGWMSSGEEAQQQQEEEVDEEGGSKESGAEGGGGAAAGSMGLRLNKLLKRVRVLKIVDEEAEEGLDYNGDIDPRVAEIKWPTHLPPRLSCAFTFPLSSPFRTLLFHRRSDRAVRGTELMVWSSSRRDWGIQGRWTSWSSASRCACMRTLERR